MTADVDAELRAEDARLAKQQPLPAIRCRGCGATTRLARLGEVVLCKPCRILFGPLPMVLSENRTKMWESS